MAPRPSHFPGRAKRVIWIFINGGPSQVEEYVLTTPALSAPVQMTTSNGVILLNGQPSFPKLVWAQCPDAVEGNLAVGIDLFMGNGCGTASDLATWVSDVTQLATVEYPGAGSAGLDVNTWAVEHCGFSTGGQ